MSRASDNLAQIDARLDQHIADKDGKSIDLGLCALAWAVVHASDRIAHALREEPDGK